MKIPQPVSRSNPVLRKVEGAVGWRPFLRRRKGWLFRNRHTARLVPFLKINLQILSFPPRIRVRDKLRRESRLLVPGFRVKPGMTSTKS